MACAQQLARAGHEVHVYEKFAKAGGLMRYGIPDFKMEKTVIDRRVEQMVGEGVVFHYNTPVGGTAPNAVDPAELAQKFDAIALTGGAEHGRDLPIPGRELDGIHFAMDFLPQQNRRVGNEPLGDVKEILAGGKHVIVSRHRRRRHRFGLYRHLAAPGRAVGDPARNHAGSAGERRQGSHLA